MITKTIATAPRITNAVRIWCFLVAKIPANFDRNPSLAARFADAGGRFLCRQGFARCVAGRALAHAISLCNIIRAAREPIIKIRLDDTSAFLVAADSSVKPGGDLRGWISKTTIADSLIDAIELFAD